MEPRRKFMTAGLLLVFAAGGVFLGTAPLRDGTQVREGVHFMRHEDSTGGAGAHAGELWVGEDDCLYVTVHESGDTVFIAVVGPGDQVSSDGVLHIDQFFSYERPLTFGRVDVDREPPRRLSERCTLASEIFGVSLY